MADKNAPSDSAGVDSEKEVELIEFDDVLKVEEAAVVEVDEVAESVEEDLPFHPSTAVIEDLPSVAEAVVERFIESEGVEVVEVTLADGLTQRIEVSAAEVDAVPKADPIAVVVPGQDDGYGVLVSRLVGLGDIPYTERTIERVIMLQLEHGMMPTGVVSGAFWAYLMRDLKPGDTGLEVMILRRLLGLDPVGGYDAAVESGVRMTQAEAGLDRDGTLVDRDTWFALIAAAI